MSYFEFPHTRTYDDDLGWLIRAVEELKKQLNSYIELNSIKFADPINWDITKQYEANTIVIDTLGNGFISRKAVPAGVSLNNREYWVQVAAFGAMIENLMHQIAAADEETRRTASQDRVIGELVWLDKILFRCVRAISAGDAYVDGENVESVTIEGVINDAYHRIDSEIETRQNEVDRLEEMIDNTGVFAGKKVIVCGDSIVYGDMTEGRRSINPWPFVLGELTKAEVTNAGDPGACMAGTEDIDFINKVYTINWMNYDYVLIAYGTNDPAKHHVLIGDNTQTGFGFSYVRAIEHILGVNNKINIVLCTANYCASLDWKEDAGYEMSVREVNNEIRNLARAYNLKVLDFEKLAGINGANLEALTVDGLHFNDDGYMKLGQFAAGSMDGQKVYNINTPYVYTASFDCSQHVSGDKIEILSTTGYPEALLFDACCNGKSGFTSGKWSKFNNVATHMEVKAGVMPSIALGLGTLDPDELTKVVFTGPTIERRGTNALIKIGVVWFGDPGTIDVNIMAL